MLKLDKVSGGYRRDNTILKGVNLTVQGNEALAIIGQNGAGKSSLAKAILNMLPYMSGKVFLNNKILNGMKTEQIVNEGVGFFVQGGRVFPHRVRGRHCRPVVPGYGFNRYLLFAGVFGGFPHRGAHALLGNETKTCQRTPASPVKKTIPSPGQTLRDFLRQLQKFPGTLLQTAKDYYCRGAGYICGFPGDFQSYAQRVDPGDIPGGIFD